jgi:thiol:disulfide interchange protein
MQQYNEPPPYNVQNTSVQPAPVPPGTYVGNGRDMTSFLAMLAGVGILLTSCTGIGGCLLPLFALVAGIIGLRNSKEAINPGRTRTHAWIAIITGSLFLVFIIAIIGLYGALIVTAIQNPGAFE